MAYGVSKAHFSELVERALSEVPEAFASALEEVPIEIRDRSTAADRQLVGVGPNGLLLGLYRGVALTRRTVEAPPMPAVIYLFQEDIEQACSSERELVGQVRATVLHEIGHHFGLDEEDLKSLGYG